MTYTYIHADTHIQADTCMPAGQREGSLTPAGGPSCLELLDPPLLIHLRTPPVSLACIYYTPIGCMAQPQTLVRHLSCPPQTSPSWRNSRSQGWLQARTGGGLAGRLERQCVSQQAAGGLQRGSTWRAACRHTWVNRNNGGCSLAQPPFHRHSLRSKCPECHPSPQQTQLGAARGQLKGTSCLGRAGGKGSRGGLVALGNGAFRDGVCGRGLGLPRGLNLWPALGTQRSLVPGLSAELQGPHLSACGSALLISNWAWEAGTLAFAAGAQGRW